MPPALPRFCAISGSAIKQRASPIAGAIAGAPIRWQFKADISTVPVLAGAHAPGTAVKHRLSARSGLLDVRPTTNYSTSSQMLVFLVSRKKIEPTTTVTSATVIGNQSPAYLLPVAATIDVAITGVKPPNHPLPK